MSWSPECPLGITADHRAFKPVPVTDLPLLTGNINQTSLDKQSRQNECVSKRGLACTVWNVQSSDGYLHSGAAETSAAPHSPVLEASSVTVMRRA